MFLLIKICLITLGYFNLVKASDDRINLPWSYNKSMSNDDYKEYLRDILLKCRLTVERMDERLSKDPQVCISIANYYCNKYFTYYPDKCKQMYKFDHFYDKTTTKNLPLTKSKFYTTTTTTATTQINSILNPSEIYRIISTNSLSDIIKNVEYIRNIGNYCLTRENDYQCVQILKGLKSRSKECKRQKDSNDCKLLATNLCIAFPDIKICENQSKRVVKRSAKNSSKKSKNQEKKIPEKNPSKTTNSTKKVKSGKNWKSFFMKKTNKN
jgi:hypothetical protein